MLGLVWFGLEATVASLSALSVILCAVMALLIIIGLCSSTPASSSGTSSNTHEIKHTLVHRQQYNQHDIKVIIFLYYFLLTFIGLYHIHGETFMVVLLCTDPSYST